MTYLAAAIQMLTGRDKAANLEKAERMIRLAAARGAKLVGLPEVFNWRGKRAEEPAARESLEGETLTLMARLAREHEIHVLAGSITEDAPGQTRSYNTSVLLGPDGKQLAVYRKIHLFDVDLPGRVTIKESDAKIPGAEVVSAATELGTVGLSVHGFSDYGNTMIVDPWGRVLTRASDQEGVVIAPLDMEYLDRVRRELPSLSHARLR